MDVEVFRRLLSPDGQALLAEVHERAGVESDHALGSRLRATHDGDLVVAAVTQNHLRGLAGDRFGAYAARMYFTHDTLRRARGIRVAEHRARRLRCIGAGAVVDVGCGIGADLVGLARAGLRARGVDSDPVLVEIARANLRALDLPGTVEVGDVDQCEPVADEVVSCSPDHRGIPGARGLSPSWDVLTHRLDGRAVVALPPTLPLDVAPDVGQEWVGVDGVLVERCLWGREFGQTDSRATLLPTGDTLVDDTEDPVTEAAPTDRVRFLHEPDDAVVAARLTAVLGRAIGGTAHDPGVAWISTDVLVDTPFATSYAVLHEVPARTAKLRIALRDRDIGELTIRCRGMHVRPEALRAKLRPEGSRSATLVLTRIDGVDRAFLVEPT